MTDHEHQVKILAFVGLTGSGKTTAVEYLTSKNYPKVYFGGIVYKAMQEAGIQPGDWERETIFRKEIREQQGQNFVSRHATEETRNLINAGQHRIIFDGLYTWTEYKELRHEFAGEMTVVAVVTPKHLRKQRMAKRAERPMTSQQVDESDWDEIENLEKGGPIAAADHFIHNDGSVDTLHAKINALLDEIEF